MRKIFLVAITAISVSMLFSCKSQKNGSYTVHAEIEGIFGSDVIMMIEDPSSPQGFRIDSLKASSDKIKFTGTIDTVRIAMITVDDPRHMKMSSEGPIPAMPVQFLLSLKEISKSKEMLNVCI